MHQRTLFRLLALLAVLAAAQGCNGRPPTRYAWGSYENLIYASYLDPGKLTVQDQIDIMEKDQRSAAAAHKPLPPGWHAYLGYLYEQSGRLDLAEQQLLEEKTAYPESTVFVDRLLTNLRRPK